MRISRRGPRTPGARARGAGHAAVLGLLLAVGLLVPRTAASATSELQRAAEEATRAEELAPVLRRLASRVDAFGTSVRPAELEQAVETLGKLVSRGRDLDAARAHFEEVVAVAQGLEGHIRGARTRSEEAAGEDEEALERLYRSRDWRRLDYAEVTLGYWLGWGLVGKAQRSPPGEERRRAMERAEKAFSRVSLEVALPRIATLSLLGLGIVWRELDEPERARRALERFESQTAHEGPADLLGAARYELAVLAFDAGDVERGRAQASRIPDGVLDPESELALARAELDARLARLEARGVSQGEPRERGGELERVAELVRRLSEAGGEHARAASARVLEHRQLLAGLEVGPAGDLIRAEEAYAEERYEVAREAYARALASREALAGLGLEVARYKYAVSLAKTGGEREAALRQLEEVLADGRGGAVRKPAARLYFSLAEAAVGREARSAARARRAARLLLEVDPQAPQSDRARFRLARHEGAGDADARSRLLEQVPDFSDVFPAARLELVRLRAERMQRLEDLGRADGASMRKLADDLVHDVEVVNRLVSEGRLPTEPERDARLAVLHAKAAARAGASDARVLELVRSASGRPDLDRHAERALLRLHLEILARTGRFGQIARMLFESPESAVRRHWAVWHESLRRLETQNTPRPPAGLLVRIKARLAALAPSEYRDDMALAEAEALLEAGRTEEAVSKTRALLEADPTWGNAQLLYARALQASGDAEAAGDAWRDLARGLEAGDEVWLEARLGWARARSRAGDAAAVCRIVEATRREAPGLTEDDVREIFGDLARGCEGAPEPASPRQGEGPSGTSPP